MNGSFMNERWRAIKGYEGYYEISDYGRVRSLDRYIKCTYITKLKGKICSQNYKYQQKGNYCRVALCQNGKVKHILVHRLVAQTFIPNPNNYKQINHKNGIKDDNRVCNLEWCTSSENIKHAYKNNLMIGLKGEKNPQCKLSNNDIKQIRTSNESNKFLAEKFGVGRRHICSIKNGSKRING